MVGNAGEVVVIMIGVFSSRGGHSVELRGHCPNPLPILFEAHYCERLAMRLLSTVLLTALALQLAGCKSPPKAPPRDPIKVVGVVSLLPDELSYQKFGITVFNNEKTSRPVGEIFNAAARAGAASALSLGERTVIQESVDAPALIKSMRSFPGNLDRKLEQINDDLQAMITKDKLDALVVVVETFDPPNGVNGVRVVVRAGVGYITKVEVMPHVAVIAMDKNLVRLGMLEMKASYAVTRPNDQTWSYTLVENLDSATLETVNKVMQNALESGVDEAVGSVNF